MLNEECCQFLWRLQVSLTGVFRSPWASLYQAVLGILQQAWLYHSTSIVRHHYTAAVAFARPEASCKHIATLEHDLASWHCRHCERPANRASYALLLKQPTYVNKLHILVTRPLPRGQCQRSRSPTCEIMVFVQNKQESQAITISTM